MMSYDYPHPVSRTYQYKKITKPLLERKRRARINRCLDELKDLMVDALETEGEDISKLEKADILELTVRHLQRLQASRSSELSETIAKTEDVSAESRWLSGFGHCAAEACRFLSALPGEAAERLARHLAAGLQTNRQTNSSPKSALLTPTLANLDRTANLVAPCHQSPTIDVLPNTRVPSVSKITPQKASPYSEINLGKSFTLTSFCVSSDGSSGSLVEDGKLSSSYKAQSKSSRDRRMSTKMKSNEAEVNEDEEEIDVERVDEGDPMWRPW